MRNSQKFEMGESGKFLIGALTGAVAGLVLAPEAGSTTRANIKTAVNKFSNNAGSNLQNLGNSLVGNWGSVASSARNFISKWSGNPEAAVNSNDQSNNSNTSIGTL